MHASDNQHYKSVSKKKKEISWFYLLRSYMRIIVLILVVFIIAFPLMCPPEILKLIFYLFFKKSFQTK